MKGNAVFSRPVAEKIMSLIRQKLLTSSNEQKRIRIEIRKLGFYASDFGLGGGYTVQDFLSVAKIVGSEPVKAFTPAAPRKTQPEKRAVRSTSDEAYILDLCDEVLSITSLRQHRFAFLRGDTGHRLPVDAYYPSLNLVIEYRERQHTEAVNLFDKRMTSSGITRGEQRKKYDDLRKVELPKNGIQLVEFDYKEFPYTAQKRLKRERDKDKQIIQTKLQEVYPG